MSEAIEQTVYFTVTVRCFDRGDHWVAQTLQTGVYTYGASREEAETRNGEANELLVRRMKREGVHALERFMKDHGIDYRIGGRGQRAPSKRTGAWETVVMSELARAA